MPPKETKKEEKKPNPRSDKAPQKKPPRPLTEEEKACQANIEKIEKDLDATQKQIKEVLHQIHDKDVTRRKLQGEILEHRDAIKKIQEQAEEKRTAQGEAFNKAQQYISALRKRKNRRADERAELLKLLPRGAELPPLRSDDAAGGVSDYDRAIKIVQQEIEKVQFQHSTTSFSKSSEHKMMGTEARLKNLIERIKELEAQAAAPLADLAEVDVMGLLETCRKLKVEINQLYESCEPHYAAIAENTQKLAENRAAVPKLIKERAALFARVKELVGKLHEASLKFDLARFKAIQASKQKQREELEKESETIKARYEDFKKKREAQIQKALNTLPFEREVAAAKELLGYLRSIALPGTCGIPETAVPKTKTQTQPTLASAPSVDIEEASFGATEMVVSRKTVAVPKPAKKQSKKKAAQAKKSAEPKKKTLEDSVRIAPVQFNRFEILSLNPPETYGEVEARYNEIKEKLEGFEKLRAEAKEQREKSIKEAENKPLEEPKKTEEPKAEEEEPKAEEPKAEEPKEEEPKAEEPAPTEVTAETTTAEEPAAESQ